MKRLFSQPDEPPVRLQEWIADTCRHFDIAIDPFDGIVIHWS